MAQALFLDSEALDALAHPGERGSLAERTRAIVQLARDHGAIVRAPAPVLAEVCRSAKLDAAVNHVLASKGIVVEPLTDRIARRAGHLLARAKLSSAHAVDAFVVATALDFRDRSSQPATFSTSTVFARRSGKFGRFGSSRAG